MKRWIALILAGLGTAAMPARGEDLLELYRQALTSDPSIREAEANRRAAREAKPQAISALLPNITGFAQRAENDNEGTRLSFFRNNAGQVIQGTVDSQSDTTDELYNLQLRQSVFSWQNWVALKRADRQVAQAEADFAAAQQDLILRVAERYFDVLAALDNVNAQSAALEAISRQLEQAEKRFEVGLIAITDVQEAKAARDQAAAALIAAKRQLATAEELLREIIGNKPTTLAKPGPGLVLKAPEPADEQQWVETALRQNLALLSTRLAAEIARDNVRSALGGHLPTLDLVASRSSTASRGDSAFRDIGAPVSTTSPIDTDGDSTQIQLQLSVPIFAGGGTQSRVRQSEYQWIAAKERLERVSRQTERLARDAYLGVISEISRVNALRQALESSQTALKATEAGYEVGTRTAVDVLDARRALVQAQTNYARSRYDYILNVIRLRSAAGNLDVQALTGINAWLDEPVSIAPSAAAPPP
ncbi:MAG: TolC family outer membrane protein, partial [Steroidobacteraceae bacterium]|nr:TolC family outer membrane protein [Steroidobacteraceae bacterium]MDW8260379.1 TolC family outer membrane protein [Gammaproteobacteria bacterium]